MLHFNFCSFWADCKTCLAQNCTLSLNDQLISLKKKLYVQYLSTSIMPQFLPTTSIFPFFVELNTRLSPDQTRSPSTICSGLTAARTTKTMRTPRLKVWRRKSLRRRRCLSTRSRRSGRTTGWGSRGTSTSSPRRNSGWSSGEDNHATF